MSLQSLSKRDAYGLAFNMSLFSDNARAAKAVRHFFRENRGHGQGFHTLMRLVTIVGMHLGQGFHTLLTLLTMVKMGMGQGFHTP